MIQNKFFMLMIIFLWMAGGFGALLSLIYMGQYRRRNWWSIGHTVSVPRTLIPLYSSLLFFCTGLALHIYTTQIAIALWVAIGWGGMALLFAIQAGIVAIQAVEEGWDTPLVAIPFENGLPTGIVSAVVVILLLTNLGLLGWWGIREPQAGGIDAILTWWSDRSALVTTPAAIQPTPNAAQISTPSAQSIPTVVVTSMGTDRVVSTAEVQRVVTPLAIVNAAPAIVTIAAPAAQVTSAPRNAVIPLQWVLSINSRSGANLRDAPLSTAPVVAELLDGASVVAVGRTTTGAWILIRLDDGTTGWIATPLVTLDGPVDSLPVMASGS